MSIFIFCHSYAFRVSLKKSRRGSKYLSMWKSGLSWTNFTVQTSNYRLTLFKNLFLAPFCHEAFRGIANVNYSHFRHSVFVHRQEKKMNEKTTFEWKHEWSILNMGEKKNAFSHLIIIYHTDLTVSSQKSYFLNKHCSIHEFPFFSSLVE